MTYDIGKLMRLLEHGRKGENWYFSSQISSGKPVLGQLVDDYLLDFDIFHVSHVTELLHYIEPKYLSGNWSYGHGIVIIAAMLTDSVKISDEQTVTDPWAFSAQTFLNKLSFAFCKNRAFHLNEVERRQEIVNRPLVNFGLFYNSFWKEIGGFVQFHESLPSLWRAINDDPVWNGHELTPWCWGELQSLT